jgi:L-threonylcarbamoyladenylate synthase
METRIYQIPAGEAIDPAALEPPVRLLQAGELVALPTETVYGLAGVATNLDAVARIFAAKERPTFDPLIVHVPDRGWIPRLTAGLTGPQRERVGELVDAFWPGPLTLLLPRNPEVIRDLVTSGSDLVALRSPAHPVFRAVIGALDEPLAAPSANRFGRISPTSAPHVLAELGGRIPMIVDGGHCEKGIESTILRVNANGSGTILRHGPIPLEVLEERLPLSTDAPRTARGRVEAPGTLENHYAPRTPLVLVRNVEYIPDFSGKAGYLTWGGGEPGRLLARFSKVLKLNELAGDWISAARNLFGMMRELDEAGLDVIYARELPEDGLARAIMDRLRRAAARRPDHPA